MDVLHIKKDGRIFKRDREVKESPLPLLGNRVRLQKGFLLSSFFSMMQRYPVLKSLNALSGELFKMIADAGEERFKSNEIEVLEFSKTIEIKGFPGEPDVFIYHSLKGVKEGATRELRFFHLENLLDHELRLGKLKHVIFGDREDVLMFDTFYTLFELADGICWELSFNFNPLECSIRR